MLARDLNWCIRLGGNIYFLAKIGATDGLSFQQMAGSMTGMSEEEYRDDDRGGRSVKATAASVKTATHGRTGSRRAKPLCNRSGQGADHGPHHRLVSPATCPPLALALDPQARTSGELLAKPLFKATSSPNSGWTTSPT